MILSQLIGTLFETILRFYLSDRSKHSMDRATECLRDCVPTTILIVGQMSATCDLYVPASRRVARRKLTQVSGGLPCERAWSDKSSSATVHQDRRSTSQAIRKIIGPSRKGYLTQGIPRRSRPLCAYPKRAQRPDSGVSEDTRNFRGQ